MTEFAPYFPIATLALAFIAALFAIVAVIVVVRRPLALERAEVSELLRFEGDAIRAASDAEIRAVRQELVQTINQQQGAAATMMLKLSEQLLRQVDSFGLRLETSNKTTEGRINEIGTKLNTDIGRMEQGAAAHSEALRTMVERKLDQSGAAHADSARNLREELSGSFQRMRQGVSETLGEISNHQKERLDATKLAIDELIRTQGASSEQLRQTVEGRLDQLRTENAAELEKVRTTVDEKLQTTLEARLNENFGRVVEQLNKAYEVFGEMRSISTHVGDLKNVLTNPKLRGTFGEVQLAMLLQDFLSPTQYVKDAQIKPNSAERVEYAIRLPMIDGDEMLLPVDAKFPREDHEHMLEALEANDIELAGHFRKQLENRIKAFAKDIAKKYINPPRTTERAILFLPTESLFAEVLRIPGLFDHVQRECNVMLAGPTTFAAILHAFQVNHRSMVIAERSGDVWKILSAVRTEFKRYNDTVGKVARQLNTAAGSVAELDKRSRLMDRALRDVAVMPDDGSAARMLGLNETPPDDGDDDLIKAMGGTARDAVLEEDAPSPD
ncbi:DNA recombination protein RmuC [Rhodopseudomonas boonkerdii]|uniref:DNA recombination protein RmuC n=1 Tax=Rhodopseudomonas boonkerdii TaxID=475937 RepID=UPI001E3C04DE|nr:DNA recombination protein RmuC [Rhodopseudomonas boonkerdii]UGV27462.1 DNA recombination protein RmuC [Rhodopseudomonas boonkerdii]